MIQINSHTLSKEEEAVLISALEIYSRIFQGQFSHLGEVFCINNTGRLPERQLTEIRRLLDDAQKVLHGDTSTSWRITSNFVSRSAIKAHRLELIAEGDLTRAEEILNLAGFNHPNHDQRIGPTSKSPPSQ